MIRSALGRSRTSAIFAKSLWCGASGSTKRCRYIDLVALCQFLPGPASSQVGFSSWGFARQRSFWRGWRRGSIHPRLLPSSSTRAFTLSAAAFAGPVAEAFLHGLKLVAVAVVAQAVWGMTRTLTPPIDHARHLMRARRDGRCDRCRRLRSDRLRELVSSARLPVLTFCRAGKPRPPRDSCAFLSRDVAALRRSCFLRRSSLFRGLSAAVTKQWRLFGAFYRLRLFGVLRRSCRAAPASAAWGSGYAGHWVTNETFLAGYGLTQAMPGPLFTFAAYLGAVMQPTPNGVAGSAIALIAIFLPGVLLVYGMLPFWDELRSRQTMQAAMRGANAAVVGILGLALYNPIWTSAVLTPRDFAFALGGFLLLTVWKVPPWIVVVLLAAGVTLLVVPHYS